MSEADEARMAKFYAMEAMTDRDFVFYGLSIISRDLQGLLDVWLPAYGGSSNYHVIDDSYWDFVANIRVCVAARLLDTELIDELALLTKLGGLFLSAPNSKLADPPATKIVNKLGTLKTLEAVARDGDPAKMYIQVLKMNLNTTRDRYRSALRTLDHNFLEIAAAGATSAFSRFSPTSQTVPAELSDVDQAYRSGLGAYEPALQAAIDFSRLAADRPSETSRIFWSSLLFTRLIGFGVSIARLTPGSSYVNGRLDKIWDNSAVSTLARAAYECFLLFFYLGIDEAPEDEWAARQNLMYLHDATMRLRVFYTSEADAEAKAFYAEQRDTLLQKLDASAYFQSLTEGRRADLRRGRDLFFLTQDEILTRMGWDQVSMRRFYELLSAHTHSLPVAFYMAIEDGRGRGVETGPEKSYMAQTLQFVATLLSAATDHYKVASAPHLPGEAEATTGKS